MTGSVGARVDLECALTWTFWRDSSTENSSVTKKASRSDDPVDEPEAGNFDGPEPFEEPVPFDEPLPEDGYYEEGEA